MDLTPLPQFCLISGRGLIFYGCTVTKTRPGPAKLPHARKAAQGKDTRMKINKWVLAVALAGMALFMYVSIFVKMS